ncbi:MAG: GWxTD domain-containing protein [Candidatus Eisenbacteria bacterium]
MRFIRLLAVVLCFALAAPPTHARTPAPVPESRRLESAQLAQHAALLLLRGSLEARHTARTELERAVLLDPGNTPAVILLGRWYESARFYRAARLQFLHVLARDPADADARAGLARLWRHDWLRTSDGTSLDSALTQLGLVTRPAADVPSRLWVMDASLRAEKGDVLGALAAASNAVGADTADGEAWMTWAAMRWLSGDPEGADSTFEVAFAHLPARVRGRFADVTPITDDADTSAFLHLTGEGREDFARRFWVRLDPDPTTWENEARLEYWSRVARAYLLFWAPSRKEWDDRGETYVRFGPPERVITNPVQSFANHPTPGVSEHLVWWYPRYQVRVPLYDAFMMELFQFAVPGGRNIRADSATVERANCMSVAHGQAVLPRVPPGMEPLAMRTQLARFPGEARTQVAAWLEVPGGPASAYTAEYVVLDSSERVVARSRVGTSPSGCAADAFRVADFTSALAPGDYVVGLSASAPGRRGTVTRRLHVDAPDTSLTVGDLVVTCGTPAVLDSSVRLSPNPAGRVRPAEALTVYFEIHRLALDARGQARFEYAYVVRPREADRRGWMSRMLAQRPAAVLQLRQVERHVGPIRRQFLRVPTRGLAEGEYRIELEVRDLVAGRTARTGTDFTVTSRDDGPLGLGGIER